MVFYRKYRPKTFEELDSSVVREKLVQIMSSDNIPHAFLFTGPKGTGKTSAARIIAKVLNCQSSVVPSTEFMLGEVKALRINSHRLSENKKKRESIRDLPIEPCNTCDSCMSIMKGTNLDVLEIDAASNRGIEEVRTLRDNIRLLPISLRYKVYIIDEVHMMTTEAFNALLKTLEEPPPHAIFILATTDAHKVPATVASRCTLIAFPKATPTDIVRALKRIAEAEGLTLSDESAIAIATHCDGAFRDAVKILEDAAREQKSITLEVVQQLLHLNVSDTKEFMRFLAARDSEKLLAYVGKLAVSGTSFPDFLTTILHELHQSFLGLYQLTDIQESIFSKEEVIDLVRLFSKALLETKSAVITELPLELAIAEWCIKESKNSDENKNAQNQSSDAKSTGDPMLWQKVIDAIKGRNHAVAAVLRSCKPLTLTDGTAIIETAYQFHFDRLKEPKTIELLSDVISELVGQEVKVKPKLSTQKS